MILLERPGVSVAKHSFFFFVVVSSLHVSISLLSHLHQAYQRRSGYVYNDELNGLHIHPTGRSCIKSTPTPWRAPTAQSGYWLLSGYNLPKNSLM